MESKIKVLLIEDNPGDAKIIKHMLYDAKEIFFEIEHEKNLASGLEHIKENDIDVILLDLSLPDSNGFATFMNVQNDTREIPIIVLSGLDDEELAVRSVTEGAQDYLVKGQVASNLLSRSIRYSIERKHMEEGLRKSIEEKEVMLKEIHHRVKNNLQVVSSLLRLQSQKISNEEALNLLKDSQNRVKSMALIHEKLYQSGDFTNINFSNYIQDLVGGLFQSYSENSQNVSIINEVIDISLNVETAIPCGLIINELVSNSLKHAFPNMTNGKINVKMNKSEDDMITLKVSDNGVGIPKGLNIKKTNTLGIHLVNILVEDQLEGRMKVDSNNGTSFQIEFRG